MKEYGFLFITKKDWKRLARTLVKTELQNINKKLLNHTKNSGRLGLNTASKRVNHKITEATRDLIGHKITNKIKNNSPQHNSQTEEKSIEIPKVGYILSENKK